MTDADKLILWHDTFKTEIGCGRVWLECDSGEWVLHWRSPYSRRVEPNARTYGFEEVLSGTCLAASDKETVRLDAVAAASEVRRRWNGELDTVQAEGF